MRPLPPVGSARSQLLPVVRDTPAPGRLVTGPTTTQGKDTITGALASHLERGKDVRENMPGRGYAQGGKLNEEGGVDQGPLQDKGPRERRRWQDRQGHWHSEVFDFSAKRGAFITDLRKQGALPDVDYEAYAPVGYRGERKPDQSPPHSGAHQRYVDALSDFFERFVSVVVLKRGQTHEQFQRDLWSAADTRTLEVKAAEQDRTKQAQQQAEKRAVEQFVALFGGKKAMALALRHFIASHADIYTAARLPEFVRRET